MEHWATIFFGSRYGHIQAQIQLYYIIDYGLPDRGVSFQKNVLFLCSPHLLLFSTFS